MLSIFVCSQSSPRLLGRSNHYTLADQNCYDTKFSLAFRQLVSDWPKLIIYNVQFSLAFRQLVSDWPKLIIYNAQFSLAFRQLVSDWPKLIIYNAQFSLAFRQLVSDRNQVCEWNKFETYTTQWDTWRWHHSLSVPVATHRVCSSHMPSLKNRSWP